jgi:dolichol-phosphate mannosyltransferase
VAEVLVIVPTYNEIGNLAAVLGRLRQAVPAADVLVVDDASPDGTGALADAFAADDPSVSVWHRTSKAGLGRAYVDSFERALAAGYSFLVEMDADGSHDPAELPAMLAIAASGADLVLGSRWVTGGAVRNWPWLRQAISRIGNSYARTVLGSKVHDLTSGFRVFRAEALRSLDLNTVSSQGYCFQVEVAWRLERRGARIVEHPITFVERTVGRSKMHAGIVAEALLRVTGWGLTKRRRRA